MDSRSPASIAVLTSWKGIAQYMGKGVRTVQRWEQDFGLPVRRPFGSDKKAVLARRCDLDAWVAIRCGTHAGSAPLGRQNLSVAAVCVRSSLAAEIQTSRMLRTTNQSLRTEMRSALQHLNECLITLQKIAA